MSNANETSNNGAGAMRHGLTLCLTCHHLNTLESTGGAHCSRCGSLIHARKLFSLVRSWFYLILALLLMIPANVLPIMTIYNLGRGEPSTIIGGVVYLIHHHVYGIALVIFIASFLVPLGKLICLALLLVSVHVDLGLSAVARTKLYRVVEFLGRWSMLDVFVVALLVGLVRLGQIANIEPEAGAMAFGAVVVITMLAAHSFDPRLIWDNEYVKKNS
jgi:paraquat-inducible protein A